jgi:hypothetical protein
MFRYGPVPTVPTKSSLDVALKKFNSQLVKVLTVFFSHNHFLINVLFLSVSSSQTGVVPPVVSATSAAAASKNRSGMKTG